MRLIAFTGFALAGKSSAAKMISKNILHFAEPVKRIAKDSFGWNGEKDEKGRRLLQVIGTECGREYNPNIWVDKMSEILSVYKYMKKFNDEIVCIDDLRFDNEAEMVHEFGGIVIEIKRPGIKASEHASEKGISPHLIDYTIEKDNLETLRFALYELLELPTTQEC